MFTLHRCPPSDSVNNHLIVSTSHHPLGIYNSAVSRLCTMTLSQRSTRTFTTSPEKHPDIESLYIYVNTSVSIKNKHPTPQFPPITARSHHSSGGNLQHQHRAVARLLSPLMTTRPTHNTSIPRQQYHPKYIQTSDRYILFN